MSVRAKLDRIVVRGPSLEPGEHVVVQTPANREVSSIRNVGGMLFVTDRALYFSPTFIERWMRAKAWRRPISEIASMRTPDRQLRKAFAGGLGARLEISFIDSVETFVLGDGEAVDTALRKLRPATP